MKKFFLLLLAGACVAGANAQESRMSIVNTRQTNETKTVDRSGNQYHAGARLRSAAKTTSTNSRWYDYVNYLDTLYGSSSQLLSANYLWNDTTSQDIYSGPTLSHNTMVSIGDVFDPTFTGFNDAGLYPGQMQITSSDAYVVDSVEIVGIYGFNAAKTSVVDTLRLGFVSGGATSGVSNIGLSYFTGETANYSVDTLTFPVLFYDSTTNRIANRDGSAPAVAQDILLTSASWGDTTSNGIFDKVYALNTPLSVSAANIVGMSLSFKSGDASFVPNDTVFTGNPGPSLYRYNMFRPALIFNSDGTNPVFAHYSSTDRNEGVFKTLPNFTNGWENAYVPMWGWTGAGGGASTLQYPLIVYHVTCTTCNNLEVGHVSNISTVNALPNPASSQLTINYALSAQANVNVTLINMVGQTVKTQHVANTTNGKVTFNVSELAAGVYFYTVEANGERTTNRVVVAH